MPLNIPAEYLVDHYPNRREKWADGLVHAFAIPLASAAAAVLITLAAVYGHAGLIVSAALYGAALTLMLAFSAVYNLTHISPARPFLRRLDEAGIFLMIAGSYTPFTTQALHGAWAVSMTSLVWALAGLGIVGKLAVKRIPDPVWTGFYVAFGWVAVAAIWPLVHSLPLYALLLLIAGGLLYTVGAVLFHQERLPFRRAIWHGCVVAAAGLHYAAILGGVVITAIRAA